jgi:pleiotropic regulator 1
MEHTSTVRALGLSLRHPCLFSGGDDKMIKCWDLETNKSVSEFYGHSSEVHTLALHLTLDVLVSGGTDGTVRVWDVRTRRNVHVLTGHTGTISDVKCQDRIRKSSLHR